MTLEKKGTEKRWRTVTPDIGTDTKSLIWPPGLFPAGRRNPFRSRILCRYATPSVRALGIRARKKRTKKKNETPLLPIPRYIRPSLRPSDPGGKENTPHCHIGD